MILILAALAFLCCAVDRNKFKTCENSGFCRRNRAPASLGSGMAPALWQAQSARIVDRSRLEINLEPTADGAAKLFSDTPTLKLTITAFETGAFRIEGDEVNARRARYRLRDVLLEGTWKTAAPFAWHRQSADGNEFTLGAPVSSQHAGAHNKNASSLFVSLRPLVIALLVDGERTAIVNARSLFNMEHMRERPPRFEPVPEPPAAPAADAVESEHEYALETQLEPETYELEEAMPAAPSPGAIMDPDEAVEHEERVDDEGDNKRDGLDHVAPPAQPPTPDTAASVGDRDAWWEETFDNKRDTKRNGPNAISIDVEFHGAEHVYGLPEHASSYNLETTRGAGADENAQPYRLYNLDVFEYELDEQMALYGAVPFVMAHSVDRTVGVFWHNAAEMWVDVARPAAHDGAAAAIGDALARLWSRSATRVHAGASTYLHWIAESGVLDLFLLPGPTPHAVLQQYYALTGLPAMPPMFALGYHQCRWNYRDEADVRAVDAGFDEHNIAYDVLWLDIEHTNGKRYFTWDAHNFPNPTGMLADIASKGRRMVTIVDPHLKRDDAYAVHAVATLLDVYVKKADGTVFEGWCWPGQSSWPDYSSHRVRAWWASQFAYDKYNGSSSALFIWNDMNEPSVFSEAEVTMPKDALHAGDVEHRDVHNAFGMWLHRATAEGLMWRDGFEPELQRRPFVLSRAVFAGTQRWGAVWTGDNKADWAHLRASVPMLLSLATAGVPFAGADVGGFFGNPDGELMTRWYQVAAFQPFFRGHAHLDAKRREPWLFGEPYTSAIRAAIRMRYTLLPYWYTLMARCAHDGSPPVRALWFNYPRHRDLFSIDDEFMVGDALLIKAVGAAGQHTTDVTLPRDVWYNLFTGEKVDKTAANSVDDLRVAVATPLDQFPLFQRGGTILPARMRTRRSSSAMARDPYSLLVAVGACASGAGECAEGELYADDGVMLEQHVGGGVRHRFTLANGLLTNAYVGPQNATLAASLRLDNIIVRGLSTPMPNFKCALHMTASNARRDLACSFNPHVHMLRVRANDVPLGEPWELAVSPNLASKHAEL